MALVVGGLCRLTYVHGRPEGGFLVLAVACLMVTGVSVYLGSILLLGVPEGVVKLWADWRQQGSEQE
jgi:hypothetical protein